MAKEIENLPNKSLELLEYERIILLREEHSFLEYSSQIKFY